MWATVKVIMILLAGFAAMVYLGTQAGILAGPRGHGSALETCLIANGMPNETVLRTGLANWADWDSQDTIVRREPAELRHSIYDWRVSPVTDYFVWINFNPTRGILPFQDREQVLVEENIQSFLAFRRAEALPLCGG